MTELDERLKLIRVEIDELCNLGDEEYKDLVALGILQDNEAGVTVNGKRLESEDDLDLLGKSFVITSIEIWLGSFGAILSKVNLEDEIASRET